MHLNQFGSIIFIKTDTFQHQNNRCSVHVTFYVRLVISKYKVILDILHSCAETHSRLRKKSKRIAFSWWCWRC